jgi:site-specific recombinase XerD
MRFQAFLRDGNLRTDQVSHQVLDQFVAYLASTAGRLRGAAPEPASIARRLAVVSSYYRFLQKESNGRIRNPLADYDRPKVNNDECKSVEDGVLRKLIEGIDNKRDRAIVLAFLYSGLRLSELQQLNVDTVHVREKQTPTGKMILGRGRVVGKGRKPRIFLLDHEALKAIAEYLATRRSNQNPALFLSGRHDRLSCRAIQQILGKWCHRLGITHIHVHQLRHSFADRMANAGMRCNVLQDLLGHSSPQTTQRYYKLRPERLAREYFGAMEFLDSSPLL